MKARWLFLCLLIGQLAPMPAHAAAAEGGARSLSIRVWTTQTIRTLIARRPQDPAQAPPVEITWQPEGLRAATGALVQQLTLSGTYRLTPAGAAPVTASGAWTISWEHQGLRVLLTLPSERYVAAAVNGEAAPDEPLASLKAMAIIVRTFALTHADRHAGEGFGLCDSTHCQALRLGTARTDVEQAVRETAGETLWFHGRRASAYFTQHCGGGNEAASAVWPTEQAPYLNRHHLDPYCLRRSPAAWRATIPLVRLSGILRAEGWHTPSSIDAVRVTARSQAGRAERLAVSGRGAMAVISASSLRFAVNRTLGWNQIRSDWYTTAVAGPDLVVAGKGYGHGVGLCQAGAMEMALEGHTEAEILAFYLPGVVIAITPGGRPWQSIPGAGWTLLTTRSPGDLIRGGNAAWAKALTLPGWQSSPVHPIVQDLPSTELFRQTTGQPGWMRASTSRSLVFLQPGWLRGDRAVTDSLLVHEFLHVLIEEEAGGRSPLWLREGMVEMLADPSETPLLDMDANQVNAALAHPANIVESRHAHRVAAGMATVLCSRYGRPAMRQFLRNGVPDEISRSLQTETIPALSTHVRQ